MHQLPKGLGFSWLLFFVALLTLLSLLQTNLIKESIRMGYNDFGDFYYAHGLLGEAFKNYVRTRDYCTTSKHIIHMCLNAILVSIEMGQFTHVTSYVSKTEQNQDALDPVTIAKLRSAAGLAHLEGRNYKLAARKVCVQYLLHAKCRNIMLEDSRKLNIFCWSTCCPFVSYLVQHFY